MNLAIANVIFAALISAAFGCMFTRISKKLDNMQALDEKRHKEVVEVRIAERELMLAEAKISALSARCIRGEHVNGDLEEAERYLTACKNKVENLAHKTAIEAMEDV